MPEPTVSAITLLRRGRLLTVMVRFVLLMGVLYPVRGGLSSPFLIIVSKVWGVAVESTRFGQIAHRTLREVRGFAEERSSRESALRSEIVTDATQDGDRGGCDLQRHRLSVAHLAQDLSHHVKVADEFGVREVESVWCVAVHVPSIASMAGKSSRLCVFSLSISYRRSTAPAASLSVLYHMIGVGARANLLGFQKKISSRFAFKGLDIRREDATIHA